MRPELNARAVATEERKQNEMRHWSRLNEKRRAGKRKVQKSYFVDVNESPPRMTDIEHHTNGTGHAYDGGTEDNLRVFPRGECLLDTWKKSSGFRV
jgi:hypothetical protein